MRAHPKLFRNLVRRITEWYVANARDLPWRRQTDPYAIWISEVMLQQTQVKTVIPYWERWMKLFPGAQALAIASESQVLKAWEGLGYYSRARNLQKAARQICAEHQGVFPRTYEEVLKLPGVGKYTAGAICSIAFGERTPILDGNVARVLSRVFALPGAIKGSATQKVLWGLSTDLIAISSDPSALNQGLMELGATVCVPRVPLCDECPLKRHCTARMTERVAEFPQMSAPSEVRQREFLALLITGRGRVLVRQRSAGIVNGALWEFPNFEMAPEEAVSTKTAHLGLGLRPFQVIKHTITRNRITLRAFSGVAQSDSKKLARELDSEWRLIRELDLLPFSSAHAKLRSLLQEQHGIGNQGSIA